MTISVDNNTRLSVVKGTAASSAIGAIVGGGYEYICQKRILNNPQEYIDRFTKQAAETAETMPKISAYLQKGIEKFKGLVESGKINQVSVFKNACICGGIVGGLYLVYRGIKALLSK